MVVTRTTNAGQRPALPGDIVGPCSTQRSLVARRSLFSRSRSEFLTLPQFLSSSTRKEEESEAGKEPPSPLIPPPHLARLSALPGRKNLERRLPDMLAEMLERLG
jgi:hypothetical protein